TTTYISKHPDKVKKLVLYAPAGMVFDAPAYMKIAKIKGLGEFIFDTVGGKILTKNCAKELLYSDDATRENYREQFAYHTQFKGMMRATLSSLRHTILDFEEDRKGYDGTRESKIPVLVVWGTNDQTMPYYQAERMQKVMPDMTLVTYEGSGHIFLYDEGARTLETTLPFLQK
ncbi:MAG: alpha/beta hydrolase, partial [Clostridia bacterium]|nr:alpha/beta hydrolase [Clostridia bacterium]